MSRQVQNRIPLTYVNIRKIIGTLAICLPLVVFLVDKVIFQRDLQTSISAYYYTEMRWYFVLTLCCIGFFLFFYQGYDHRDKVLARVAGTAAFLTAFFPTNPGKLDYCASPLGFFLQPKDLLVGNWACSLTAGIHLASAATMFLTVAYFSWFQFTKGETDKEKRTRNKVYRICGGVIFAMILMMAAASIADLLLPENAPWKKLLTYVVYWGEFISLLAFGVTWAVKGEMIWKDAVSSTSGRDFNELQNRQYLGYKSGLSFFVFLVALWFTILLFAAETAPFNLFTESTAAEEEAPAAEGVEPPVIQVIDGETLGQLCYPVSDTPNSRTDCDFYNTSNERVEKSLTITNTSTDPATVTFGLLLYSPCSTSQDCVRVDGMNLVPGQSITGQIEASSQKTVSISFANESISGEIILVGGGGLVKIPFDVSDENAWRANFKNPAGETRVLGFYKTNAQTILNGILFVLVAVFLFFILNNQVLSLFWPLVRRNFRAASGDTEPSSDKDALWTLFSNKINELGDQPRFSINPRADTAISTPTTLTPESSYLKTFFDLLNWIFPSLGYSLRLSKVSSKASGTGLSLSVIRNDRKENVAEKIFWAKEFEIDEAAEDDPGGNLEVQKLLMIPAYCWFLDEVDKMDGFETPPHEWESAAYYHLGNQLWHLKLEKGIACYTNSINFNKQNWPAYAALGRVWIEKSQQQPREISIESLLLANSYLSTAIRGLMVSTGEPQKIYVQAQDAQIYFGALYNQVVALGYLVNLGWKKNGFRATDLLLLGYKVKLAALTALLDIQQMAAQGKDIKILACTDPDSSRWKDAKIKCNDLLLGIRANSKSEQLLGHPTFKWLIMFLPTLEFVLQGLEAAETGFLKNKVDLWLGEVLEQFTTLPFFDPPVDMEKIVSSNEKRGAKPLKPHFTQSHYRIQYNAACFYSQIVQLVPEKDRSGFMDLALDHLVMALSVGGGLAQFARYDSDLDPIRKHPRFRDLVPNEIKVNGSSSAAKSVGESISVFRRKDGKWVYKQHSSSRSSKAYESQTTATNEAKKLLRQGAGGELVIHGRNGRIRKKDTIAPGNDPRRIKG